MRVRLVTTTGETHEVELDPQARSVRLELPVAGQDIPTAFWLGELRSVEVWLGELRSVEVSEHPQPVAQHAEPPRLVERELDVSSYGFTHEREGEKVRVGPRRAVRVHVPEPPAEKPKPRAKVKP